MQAKTKNYKKTKNKYKRIQANIKKVQANSREDKQNTGFGVGYSLFV